MTAKIPNLGVGLCLTRKWHKPLLELKPKQIDWLEIRPENYLERGGLANKLLDEISSYYPLIPHSISMNVGGTDPLDWNLLKGIKSLIQKYNMPYASDHIAICSHNKKFFHQQLSLPWDELTADHVAERAKQIQDFLEVPLLLENLVYTQILIEPQISEADFYNRILEKADCYLLLDITDAYLNSKNFDFDVFSFFNDLNWNRVKQFHIAGFHIQDSHYMSEHADALNATVLDLLKSLKQKKAIPNILLEREVNLPSLEEMTQEISHVKEAVSE